MKRKSTGNCPKCGDPLSEAQITSLYRSVAQKSGSKGGKVSGSRPDIKQRMAAAAKARWSKQKEQK